ncbi:MAG TPA: S1C family serine protease [Rhizomicrobium sp.]|nr:S1C family serine protease [Rhizomicrobium sp.]
MTQAPLKEFSDALGARAKAAREFTAEIHAPGSRYRSGTLWRADIVVTSEQSLPEAESYEVGIAGGAPVRATLAGRDPGTNVAVLRLDAPAQGHLPAAGDAEPGGLALAVGADGYGGVAVRLGIVSAVAPEWRSRGGGKVDRRIVLDTTLSHHEDGGPVLDAQGRLLGISTLGHRESVLAIPPPTVERSVGILLAHGRVDRGWLGVALQPVAIPDVWRDPAGGESGLMVMSTVAGGPAAAAGVLVGDILLRIDGARATHVRGLAESLGSDSIARQVELGVLRGGTVVSLRATIAAAPDSGGHDPDLAACGHRPDDSRGHGRGHHRHG